MDTPEVVLDRLGVELDEAAEVPLSCWSRDELAGWLVGLQALRARVDGLLCAAAAEADRVGVAGLDGARTTRQFAAGRCSSNPVDVGGDVALGRWLDDHPDAREALAAGQITRRHVMALRDLDNPRTRVALREGIGYLVDAAAACTWADFTEICHRWIANADPDGVLPAEQLRRRSCTVKTHVDGTVSGRFRLDPVTGASLKSAVDREAMALFTADSQPDASIPGGHRNHHQRTADALARLVARGSVRVDGRAGPPLIHVVVGQPILEEAIAAAATGQPPERLDIDGADPLRRCELVDGTPLPPSTVVGLLGVATLRRLVLGAESELLDLGRAVYRFPQHLKHAIRARDRGRCCADNCDAPLAWLQTDHIVPWSGNGRTAVDNAQTLCGPHNRAKADSMPP